MLRILQKDKLLYFSEESRSEYDLENTQLLYTFDDLHYDETLKNSVRPFKALWIPKKDFYKLKLLNYIPDILYADYSPTPTSEEEHTKTLEEVAGIAFMMGLDAYNEKQCEVKYECDTWNIIEDLYGIRQTQIFKDFLILPTSEQEYIKKVWKAGKNNRLDVARSGDWRTVIDFLPGHIQTELFIFGENNETGIDGSRLEFRKKDQIGPELPKLRDLVYQEFCLGEFLLEGATDVKDRLEKIYKTCGIEKTPKAKDLEEWFVIIPCRSKGKRGFRIDFRKQS